MELSDTDNFEYEWHGRDRHYTHFKKMYFDEQNHLAQDHIRGEFHTSVSSARLSVQIFLSGFNVTLEQEHYYFAAKWKWNSVLQLSCLAVLGIETQDEMCFTPL
jgi:hypothetical protein